MKYEILLERKLFYCSFLISSFFMMMPHTRPLSLLCPALNFDPIVHFAGIEQC